MTTVDRRVIVIGSLNDDLILRLGAMPSPGETIMALEIQHEPGGKSSNQAASAALLGARVHLYGVVGDDPAGEKLVEDARARGVDASGVSRTADAATGTAVVMVDEAGENSIIVASGANQTLTDAIVPDAAFAGTPIVVLALESPIDAITTIASRAAAAGSHVLLNASPAAGLPSALLDAASVLVVNQGEMETITGATSATGEWAQTRDLLSRRGLSRAIITLGSRGAVVIDGDEVHSLDAIRVNTVDTTGCGDAFMGAVAADLAAGRTLLEAAHTGIAAGAWAAQTLGAQRSYGTRDQLKTLPGWKRG